MRPHLDEHPSRLAHPEIRRKSGIEIELWDLARLKKEAASVGIIILRSGEEAFTYNVGVESLVERITRDLSKRVKGYPINLERAADIGAEIELIPVFICEYEIHKAFKTSTGRIIYYINVNERLLIRCDNDHVLIERLPEYLDDSSLVPLRASEFKDKEKDINLFYARLGLTENNIEGLIKMKMAEKYTKTVGYWGRNRQYYTRLCRVKERDVLINFIGRLVIPVIKASIFVRGTTNKYDVIYYAVSNKEPLLIESSVPQLKEGNCFLCNICGKLLPFSSLVRCEKCGATICIDDAFSVPTFFLHKSYCDKCYEYLATSGELLSRIKESRRNMKSLKIASILSIIPGLGEVYLGRERTGIIILAITALLLSLDLLLPVSILPYWLAVAYFLSAYSIGYDVRLLKSAIKNNEKLKILSVKSLLRKLSY